MTASQDRTNQELGAQLAAAVDRLAAVERQLAALGETREPAARPSLPKRLATGAAFMTAILLLGGGLYAAQSGGVALTIGPDGTITIGTGAPVKIAGGPVNIDASGGAMSISGEAVDIAASGQPVSISGDGLDIDASGKTVNISGGAVNIDASAKSASTSEDRLSIPDAVAITSQFASLSSADGTILTVEATGSDALYGPALRLVGNPASGIGEYWVGATGQANDGGAGMFSIVDQTNGEARLNIDKNGKVAIGLLWPKAMLDVAGDANFSGSITAEGISFTGNTTTHTSSGTHGETLSAECAKGVVVGVKASSKFLWSHGYTGTLEVTCSGS